MELFYKNEVFKYMIGYKEAVNVNICLFMTLYIRKFFSDYYEMLTYHIGSVFIFLSSLGERRALLSWVIK